MDNSQENTASKESPIFDWNTIEKIKADTCKTMLTIERSYEIVFYVLFAFGHYFVQNKVYMSVFSTYPFGKSRFWSSWIFFSWFCIFGFQFSVLLYVLHWIYIVKLKNVVINNALFTFVLTLFKRSVKIKESLKHAAREVFK